MNYSEEEKEALEILNNTEWDGFMITIKKIVETQKAEIEKRDKVLSWIKDYTQQEIDFRTEDIKDFLDDDKEEYKHIIGELKEEREHWRDIIRIMNDEKTYMDF